MKYVPASPPIVRAPEAQVFAEYVQRELRRIGIAINSMEQDGWDDLRFPAQGINLLGAVSDPVIDTSISAGAVTGTLLFAGNLENLIAGVAQLPHSMRLTEPLFPHIHWSKPAGSGNAVTWELYYKWLGNPGEVAGAWVGPVTGTIAVGDQTVSNQHLIVGFGTVATTSARESACLSWRIHRQGATDADNGLARLIEFDIHYRKTRFGSPGIYGGAA